MLQQLPSNGKSGANGQNARSPVVVEPEHGLAPVLIPLLGESEHVQEIQQRSPSATTLNAQVNVL